MREAKRRPDATAHRPLQRGDPKSHHQIPQFWLKGFCEDTRAGSLLAVVDRCGNVDRVGARGATAEELLYATTVNGATTVKLERELGRLESDASNPFKALCEGRFPSSSLERLDLSILLAVQDLRTRPRLQGLQTLMASVASRMELLAQRQGLLARADERRTFEGNREVALDYLLNDQIIAVCSMLIFRRQWCLLHADQKSMGFILPDHPVMAVSNNGNSIYGPGGIGSADEIWVPLSPRRLLVMHRQTQVDGRQLEASNDTVETVNRALVRQAREKVYCAPSHALTVANSIVSLAASESS